MKIIIIDTNVVISAILRGNKPGEVVDFIVESPDYLWVASEEIIAEYHEVVLRKKFNFSQAILTQWLLTFSSISIISNPEIALEFPRDSKDEKFLKCAIASNANYFITGDNDFEGIKQIGDTTCVSVSEFIKKEMA